MQKAFWISKENRMDSLMSPYSSVTQRRRNQTPARVTTLLTSSGRSLAAMLVLAVFASLCGGMASAQVKKMGDLTVFHVQNPQPAVDFVNAKAMPLPRNPLRHDPTQAMIEAMLSPPALGTPGSSPGAAGNGTTNEIFLGTPVGEDGVEPMDFGTNNHPFSTARADLYGNKTNKSYPYRPAGKLFFKIGSDTYICSASLIKRGIVVTAAHCVANYGASQFYSGWQFVPGYRNGKAPFGTWTAYDVWIKTAYYNGTDGCAVYGVVCPDDVAVIILNTQSGGYAGTSTGWLGYGWDGFSFTGNSLTHVSQLGYPVGLDSAAFMERNDSQGYVSAANSNNTVIGSNMNGGSSGGPWVANFGLPPSLTGESNGSAPNPNIVVGVTSWGYVSNAPKEQGASPFTSNNIVSLINSACGEVAAACQ
jgi:V8-like Glu-specific endopeptidase